MAADGVTTDFSKYTLAQLNQMLDESDPAGCLDAAQTWDTTGRLLHEQAYNLESRLRPIGADWSGTAATEYQRMMTDLVGGMRKVADTAFRMRDLTHDALDALDTARADMPAPVDVPVVSPATMALATTPLQVDANTSAGVVAILQQQQAAAVAAVQQQQVAAATAATAQAKAIAVMTALAGGYVTARTAIPPSPDAVPTVNAGTGTASAVNGAAVATPITLSGAPAAVLPVASSSSDGSAAGASASGSNPLFGDMFTVGLAAAAAAASGRFGSVMPSVPSFATKKAKPTTAPAGSATAAAGALGAARLSRAGGAISGGGLGLTGSAATPTAAAGMGAATALSPSDLTGSALGAAASTAASGEPMMPMMPMMPMSGMAGAGAGDGSHRRIPPWLVETEDVWGESSPVAPSLIGDDFF